MALDPSMEYLTRISNHGAQSIAGMGGDFRNNLFRLIYNAPPQIRDKLRVISGYRSPGHQAELWARALKKYGSESAARKWVAPPGKSRHNLGIAADLGFGSGDLGQAPKEVIAYLHQNASKYDLEFPLGNEPWHIEPLGSRGGRGGGGAQGRMADLSGGLSYGSQGGTLYRAAQKYGIDPGMLARLVMKESSGNPQAVSPVGAMGLTQIMPATAKMFGIDISTPEGQLEGGAKYLRYLMNRFNNDPKLALAAYNWGEGNVSKAGSYENVPTSVKGYVEGIMAGGEPELPQGLPSADGSKGLPSAETGQFNPASLQDLPGASPEDISGAPAEAGILPKRPTSFIQQLGGGVADAGGFIADLVGGVVAGPEYIFDAVKGLVAPDPGYLSTLPRVEGPAQPPPESPDVDQAYKQWVEGMQQGSEPIIATQPQMGPEAGGLVPQDVTSPTNFLFDLGDRARKFGEEISGGDPQTWMQKIAREGPRLGALYGTLGLPGMALDTVARGIQNMKYDPKFAEEAKRRRDYLSLPSQAEGINRALALQLGELQPNFPYAGATEQFNLNSLSGIVDKLGAFMVSPATAETWWKDENVLKALPANLDKSALETFGPLSALSMAFMFAAPVLKRLVGKIPQKVNNLPPEYAKAGTESIVNRWGVFRSSLDDMWASMLGPLAKAGADPWLLKMASHAARVEMGAGAIYVANSMIRNGLADTLSGVFNVGKKNAAELLKIISNKVPEVSEYLWNWHMIDEFSQKKAPAYIRGKSYQDVKDEIAIMEGANPQLPQYRQMYQANLNEMREFLTKGRFGLYTQKEKQKLLTERPNEVPYDKWSKEHNIENPNAVDVLIGHMTYKPREKLENEMKGLIIEAANSTGRKLFSEVTDAQIKRNPQWRKNKSIVEVWDNGKLRKYTTDPHWADIMNMDSYAVNSVVPAALFAYKRFQEELLTGRGNPGFAIKNLIRGVQLGQMASPGMLASAFGKQERAGVGYARSLLAIPRQLVPIAFRELAAHIDASLMRASPGWWGVVPVSVRKSASAMMTKAWHESWMSHIQEHGTASSTYTTQAAHLGVERMKSITDSIPLLTRQPFAAVTKTLAGLLHVYDTSLFAIHGAPSMAYAMRNLSRSKKAGTLQDETRFIINEAAELMGNPRITGRSYRSDNTPVRGYTGAGYFGQRQEAFTRAASEGMRMTVPWFNVSIQGMKRLGQAYIDNPVKFMMRAWAHQIVPTAGIYLYNKSLNETPEAKENRWDYADYMMRGRSPSDALMNWTIGRQGKHPSEGIKIPKPHELSIIGRLMEIFLHHGTSGPANQLFTKYDDIKDAMSQWLGNVMMPAPASFVQGVQLAQGQTPSPSIFENPTQPNDREFQEPGEMNKYLENWIRNGGGAIGHMVGTGYAAFNEGEGTVAGRVARAFKHAGKDYLDTIPGGNLLTGDVPYTPSRTDLTMKYQAKVDFIHKLADNYNKYGKYYLSGVEPQMETKPPSLLPGEKSIPYMGDIPPAPTNPLYRLFMARVYQDFMRQGPIKNLPPQDITGFTKLMAIHGDMVATRESLRGVTEEKMANWQTRIKNDPKMQSWINGMPEYTRDNPRRLFTRLNDDIRRLDETILLSIRKVEETMSKEMQREIKIEDLEPYGKAPGWKTGSYPQ